MEAGLERREERLLFETDRYRIRGSVTLSRGGYRSRISDVLNATERSFIPLTDVTVEPLDGEGPAQRYAFMALAREHVVFAIALDD
jgi:hypothetical protein